MRSRYRIHAPDTAYFVTGTIVEWAPAFNTADDFQILLDTLAYCQREKDLRIYAYVIMDNHFHLVCEAPELSRTLQSLKRHTARRIIERAQSAKRHWLLQTFAEAKKGWKSESAYQVWQEGSHPQELSTREMFWQKVGYIHNNPVKRGWVDLPEHWRYSSARNYELGDHSVLRLDEPPAM